MRFDLDRHLAAFDAEMEAAVAVTIRSDRQLQKPKTSAELMKPVLTALNFLSQHDKTPGLDYLVGIRGLTAEIRAERPELLSVLRLEFDGASALRIEDRRFGHSATQSVLRTATPDGAVQECINFVAHHIAQMRPELARHTHIPAVPKAATNPPQAMVPDTVPDHSQPEKNIRAPSRDLGPVQRRKQRQR